MSSGNRRACFVFCVISHRFDFELDFCRDDFFRTPQPILHHSSIFLNVHYRPPSPLFPCTCTKSSNLCSSPLPSPCLSHSPSPSPKPLPRPAAPLSQLELDLCSTGESDAGPASTGGGTTGLRILMLGEMVPGRWSGDIVPEVMSPSGVTVVGMERRRSLYDMKEIRRLSFAGLRCVGTAGEAEPD